MAAWRVAPLAALLLAGSWTAPAQGGVQVELVALEASYGPEAWKDEPPLGSLLPPEAVTMPVAGVYRNPYLDPAQPHQGPGAWLGYAAIATLEVRDAAGGPVADPTLSVEARLVHGAGEAPAKLARLAPGRFLAQVDVDGERGTNRTAASPGAASLVVEVVRAPASPAAAPTTVAAREFPLRVLALRFDRSGFPLPDGALPGYADAGAGNATLVQDTYAGRPGEAPALRPTPAPPGAALAYAVGGVDARSAVEVVAFHGTQATFTRTGNADAAGSLAFHLTAADLVDERGAGLAVLEAHLDGAGGALGSTVLAVPVSHRALRVVRYDYRPGGVAGEPLADLDMLDVTVADPAAGGGEPAVQGNITALDASGEVLASAPLRPREDRRALVASLPAALLRRDGLASYRVVGMLQEPDGSFYGLAQGFRGLGLAEGRAEAAPFERGALPVVVRNFNNNFDGHRDPGLGLAVVVAVEGLPGGAAPQAQATLDESGEARLAVPFTGDAGQYPLTIRATSGELEASLEGLAVVRPAARGLLGLPGPAAALALLALVGAAVAAQRSRTRP